jgi:hypothetical protein
MNLLHSASPSTSSLSNGMVNTLPGIRLGIPSMLLMLMASYQKYSLMEDLTSTTMKETSKHSSTDPILKFLLNASSMVTQSRLNAESKLMYLETKVHLSMQTSASSSFALRLLPHALLTSSLYLTLSTRALSRER